MTNAIENAAFFEKMMMRKPAPLQVKTFTKLIYNVSGKTKNQVEAALNLEIRWLEDQNHDYRFKECRQGKPLDDSFLFTIVFEKVK